MAYKILIVDDEQGILRMLQDYFEFHGYLVYTAINGTEAVKAVNRKPDIILLDINMPDMNGLDVCKRIREYVTCPIVFLTARIEEADTIMGFQSGGDDYVVKPFRVNELGARVAAHLRRQNRTPQDITIKFYGQLTIDYGSKEIKYPGEISGGQKQRTAIARALSNSPLLILADEPTGNLDSKSSAAVIDAFLMAKEELEATILMITHDAAAASHVDRVVALADGQVVRELKRESTPADQHKPLRLLCMSLLCWV